MIMKTTSLLLGLLLSSSVLACTELDVKNAWIRLPPPNAKMLAGYVELSNNGEQSILVQGLHSDAFNKVEMHTTEVVEGVAKMRQLDMLEVKAGKTEALAPGGRHLMLVGAKQSFKEGDVIPVSLSLCEEKQQTVKFMVAKSAPVGSEQQSETDDHRHHH
jgi:periplasmic copper chaperone A